MSAFVGMRSLVIRSDGVVEEEEAEWEKLTSQNEIDAAGLCVSFLLSQLFRYYIGGVMPNPGGVEHAVGEGPTVQVWHTWLEIFALAISCILSKLMAIALEEFLVGFIAKHPWPLQEHANSAQRCMDWLIIRFLSLVANTFHKLCGWLLLFTVSWSVQRGKEFSVFVDLTSKTLDDSVVVRAITAVLCSYLGFLAIILLERVPTSVGGRLKRGVLQSASMMVGFAWRRVYGLSIDYVTHFLGDSVFPSIRHDGQADGELLLEIAVAVPFAAVVMLAMQWYITPHVIHVETASVEVVGRLSAERREVSSSAIELVQGNSYASSAAGDLAAER